MLLYCVFMGLLATALLLWTILALSDTDAGPRDAGGEDTRETEGE